MKAQDLNKTLPAKQRTVKDLARYIQNKSGDNPNYCLFLGAGASRSSGINTGSNLIKSWRKDAYEDLCSDNTEKGISDEEMSHWLSENQASWFDPKNEYSSLFEYKFPLKKQRRIFVENEVSGKIPSMGYSYLVRLAEENFLRTILTTNFDDLLNEAFYQFSNERPIICAHDSSVNSISITSTRPKVIKLHGDYLFDNIKCTNTETGNLQANMKAKFDQFMNEYGLVISGYSGSDKSILRILENSLASGKMENGLYWCLRNEDEINDDVLNILKSDGVFFVLNEGFDELMADLYVSLCNESSPFSFQIASTRASTVIESYLNNNHLARSNSSAIRAHLKQLVDEQKNSAFISAIKSLNDEILNESKLKDSEVLKFIEIERYFQIRDFNSAYQYIKKNIESSANKKFKITLFNRLYFCAKRLNKLDEASDAADQVIALDPQNLFAKIDKAMVLRNTQDRVDYLEEVHKDFPYSTRVINKIAHEKGRQIRYGEDPGSRPTQEEQISLYNLSIQVHPAIANPAWKSLFDIRISDSKSKERTDSLENIIDEFLKQDAFDSSTSRLVFKYCKEEKSKNYKNRNIFDILEAAYVNHFPREEAQHFAVYSEACLEFGEYPLLRKLHERCKLVDDIEDDEDYTVTLMQLQLDVYRDLSGAIEIGERFLNSNKSVLVEETLLGYYLFTDNVEKAKKTLKSITRFLEPNDAVKYEANILEKEGKFQDAVDIITTVPDKEFFLGRYCLPISFLYLKMKDYKRAQEVSSKFLTAQNFSQRHQVILINYEFSKLMLKGKISKAHINPIAENPESEDVEAVSNLLLGDKAKALKILKEQVKRRFSNIYQYLSWPVLEQVRSDLEEMKERMVSNKRSSSFLIDLEAVEAEN